MKNDRETTTKQTSEDKYKSIVEHANEAIIIAQGNVLKYFNPKTLEMTGYSAEELAAIRFFNIVHPDDREMIMEQYSRRMAGDQTPHEYVFRIVDKNGEAKWVNARSVTVEWEGRPASLSICTDITERRMVEQTLQETQLSYQTMADFTYDWEYWENPDGTLRYVSPSCKRITGYGRDEFVDKPSLLHDIIVIEDKGIWAEHRQQASEKRGLHEVQFRMRARNGEIVWIEHACQPVVDVNGKFRGFRVSNRDITERKLVQEELKRKEQSLAEAQRIAHFGNWDWNMITNELWWSDEVYRIFGLQPSEFGATYDAFLESVHPDDREKVKEAVNKALLDPSYQYSIEHRIARPDGSERVVCERGEVTFNGGKPVRMIGTVHDITGRKQAQEEIEKKSAELVETNKKLANLYERLNDAREDERAGIARELHDELGQALTALRMDVSWMNAKLDKNQEPLLEKTNAMTQLIDSTIKVVQRISSELRPGILDDLGLEPAIEWYVGEFQKRRGTRCYFESEGEEVKDEKGTTALFRIVQEALTNVARHSQATRVHILLRNNEGRVSMEIKDNGKGVTQGQLNDSRASGITGMRQRIASLNGTFDVHGESGKGTTIKITIPSKRVQND